MQNATQQLEAWQRRAAYYEQEAIIALVQFDDARTFQFYSDSADKALEIAHYWKRLIHGGK
jgi:hypothetical protein